MKSFSWILFYQVSGIRWWWQLQCRIFQNTPGTEMATVFSVSVEEGKVCQQPTYQRLALMLSTKKIKKQKNPMPSLKGMLLFPEKWHRTKLTVYCVHIFSNWIYFRYITKNITINFQLPKNSCINNILRKLFIFCKFSTFKKKIGFMPKNIYFIFPFKSCF